MLISLFLLLFISSFVPGTQRNCIYILKNNCFKVIPPLNIQKIFFLIKCLKSLFKPAIQLPTWWEEFLRAYTAFQTDGRGVLSL